MDRSGQIGHLIARIQAGGDRERIPAIVLTHGEGDLYLMTRHRILDHAVVTEEDCELRRSPYFEEDETANIGDDMRLIIDLREKKAVAAANASPQTAQAKPVEQPAVKQTTIPGTNKG